jgi:hypothetical protein
MYLAQTRIHSHNGSVYSLMRLRFKPAVQKYGKWLLAFVGIATIPDFLKGKLKGAILGWIYDKLGSFGQWLLNYSFACFTVALVIGLLYLGVAVAMESRRRPSYGFPPQVEVVSRTWTYGFPAAVIVAGCFLAYGAFWYYRMQSIPGVRILGYQVILFKPGFNLFANIAFQNTGGEGKITIYSYSAAAPSILNPVVVRKTMENENKKLIEKGGGLSFSVNPMEKKWFTVPGGDLSDEQATAMKAGTLDFYFSGTIVATGKTSRTFDFCSFVVGNKPNVVL